MTELNIFLATIIPAIIIALLFFFIIKWDLNNLPSKMNIPSKGLILYYFDLPTKKIKEVNTKFSQKNILFNKTIANSWISLETLLKKVEDPKIVHQKLLSVYENLAQGSNFEKISFNYMTLSKRNTYAFNLEFRSIEDFSNYILKIRWQEDKKEVVEEEIIVSPLQKHNIISKYYLYNGFIAFHINNNSNQTRRKLALLIKRFWKHEFIHFNAGSLIIFVLHSTSRKKIKFKIERFITGFKNHAYNQGVAFLFRGSAYVYSNNINSKKNLNKIIQILEFLSVESIINSEEFIPYDPEKYGTVFKRFLIASRTFKIAIKTEQLELEKLPIKNFITDEKISNYISPKIDGITDKVLKKLLIDFNNQQLLTNTTAKLITSSHQRTIVLADINANWLIDNAQNLKNKNTIYIINYNIDQVQKINDNLRETIRDLRDWGFIFGLKVTKYEPEILTLIKLVDPKFLIVSQDIRKNKENFDSAVTINLMSLNQICQKQNIKIVYENPPKFIDEVMSEKIGLQYYY